MHVYLVHALAGSTFEHKIDRQHVRMARVDKDDKWNGLEQPMQPPVEQHQVVELVGDVRSVSEMHKLEILDHDHQRHKRDAQDGEQRCESERLEASEEREWQDEHDTQQQDQCLPVDKHIVCLRADKRLMRTRSSVSIEIPSVVHSHRNQQTFTAN